MSSKRRGASNESRYSNQPADFLRYYYGLQKALDKRLKGWPPRVIIQSWAQLTKIGIHKGPEVPG